MKFLFFSLVILNSLFNPLKSQGALNDQEVNFFFQSNALDVDGSVSFYRKNDNFQLSLFYDLFENLYSNFQKDLQNLLDKLDLQQLSSDVSSASNINNNDDQTNSQNSNCPKPTKFLSASNDKSIILWDANSNSIVKSFLGHTKAVNSLAQLSKNLFISGSSDKSKLK
jgi:WD40 repeat protein